jgi:hypothetical protein
MDLPIHAYRSLIYPGSDADSGATALDVEALMGDRQKT